MSDRRVAPPDGVSFTLRLLPHVLVASTGYVLFAVAALPDLLTARLGIGPSAFGLLTSAPLGAFVLVQPLAWWLTDRYSTARVLLWAASIHVGVAVALDLQRGFPSLLALRFLWGLIAGLVLSVGATHVARLRRGAASTLEQGVFGGMLTFGGAVAFLLAGPVVAATGGLGLHAVGIVPGLLAVACGLRHHADRRTAPQPGAVGPAPTDSPTRDDSASAGRSRGRASSATMATVGNPIVVAAGLSYVAVIGSYVTLSTFVTSYFGELGVVGPLNAFVLLGATVGRVSGGVAVWRLRVDNTALVVGSVTAAAVGFVALAVGPGGALLVAFPFATMFALSTPFGAVFDLAAGATNAEGMALAVVVAAGNVAALVLPPIAGSLRVATGGYTSVFILLACLNVVAAIGAFVLVRRPHTDGGTRNS